MARPRARRFSGGGHSRLTEWSAYDTSGYLAVASTAATLLSGLAFEDPGTIIRTRGQIVIRPVANFAADVDIVGAFGIGLVSAEAFAAGVASIPELYTDSDWGGWMVIQPFSSTFEFRSGVGTDMTQIALTIDSKAMRKVEPNSVMVFVAESLTGAFVILDQTRLLLKLP